MKKTSKKLDLLFIGILVLLIVIYALPLAIQMLNPWSKSKTSGIIAAMGEIRNAAELIYDDSKYGTYDALCFEDTFNEKHDNYGDELARIEKDIIDNGGAIRCLATGDEYRVNEAEYCVYAALPFGEWWCIDSTGRSDRTTINPNRLGYCNGIAFVCPPGE